MNARPFTDDDLPAIHALLVADEEQLFGRPSKVGVDDLHEWIERSPAPEDRWLFEDADGVTAVGWAFEHDALGVGIGVVHPRAKGRGLGGRLVDRSEARVRERGAARVHQFALGPDTAARELLLGRGYADVRHFYEMAIQLESRPDAPAIAVETFREEDARVFHDALDESFQDHWEHHGTPFEEWWERHRANPSFDPTLWFLIRDGDEVAAVARNDANRNGGGYVGALGVRRPWRGKGYAKALLQHTFREFYDRGVPRITLGVDAESPTGATHLYERVGMHVEQENVVFEKQLA